MEQSEVGTKARVEAEADDISSFHLNFHFVLTFAFAVVLASYFVVFFSVRGVAQHGLARLPWEQEVAGSNPVAPTMIISTVTWG